MLAAALERGQVPALERARWHRMLAEAHMQLGEMAPARHHFERALALLGHRVPTSTAGWLDMLATQALQRRLRRVGPGAPVERTEERRARAAEPAAVCWQLQEACWMLEDQAPLMPLAVWGMNLAERAGRSDLAVMNQASLGNTLTAAGLHRLARRHVHAAVAGAERASDPWSVTWTQIVASLHWLGVGDWAALDAGLPRALEAGATGRLHRATDQALLLGGVCRYLTGRFEEAAAMAADAAAAGRERRDPMVELWGLLVLLESRLRTDPGDPAIAGRLEASRQLVGGGIPVVDVVRLEVAAARFHLAAGRTADAWQAVRAAAALAGPEPSFHPYTLEAHAGIPEVCLALLERGQPAGADPGELRTTGSVGLRRLRRYARSFPMARPRALACAGWWHWLEGRHGAAQRAWTRAVRAAERLAMPWELANAHAHFGRHLPTGERSPLGLEPAGHLDRARSIFEALGCRGGDAHEARSSPAR
jgi:hypothetical protein